MLTASFKRPEPTPLERRQLFQSISAPFNPQDFNRQLLALIDLTNQGKDVVTFESDLMPLLTRWLEYWFQAAGAARKKEKEKSSKAHGVLVEDNHLNAIYSYVNDLVRFSFSAFQEQDISSLLSQLLQICKRTTVSSDIKSAVDIFNALVIYGEIPRVMLEPCLDVLCGAYGTLKDLADPIWNTMCNLGKSHTAQNMAAALLDIIRSPSMHVDRNTNAIRGAVIIMSRIMIADGEDGLVKVSFSAAMGAFQMSLAANSLRLEVEVIGAVVRLLGDDGFGKVLLQEEDWSVLLDILAQCSRKVNEATGAPSKGPKEKENTTRMSDSLKHIIHYLESLCSRSNFDQRQSVIDFFKAIHSHLPDTCAEILVQHYAEEHLCYPSNPDWLTEAEWLIQAFFLDMARPASTRMTVLQAIKDIYQIAVVHFPSTTILELVMPVFRIMPEETDSGVLEGLRIFAVEIASQMDETVFDAVVASLHACLISGRKSSTASSDQAMTMAHSPQSKSKPAQRHSPAATAAIQGLITIFIRSLNCSAFKASKIFDLLLEAAQSRTYDLTARINAFRALFRLRSDSANAIYLTTDPESEAMASALGRTAASGDLKRIVQEPTHSRQSRQENAGSAQSSRSSSTGGPPSSMTSLARRSTNPATRHLNSVSHWVYPNKHALPENPPSTPSTLVFCHPRALGDTDDDTGDHKKTVLKVKVWLEAVISILQQEDDWDLYSYVIVHLGSQLSNHALFMDAAPQIQMLRSVLCEQLRVNSFREPPLWAGLKRLDVMICFFHILTILLTYHEHFSKNEQDEIVRTFMMGVGSGERTAKHCIHALSICCHEISLSISKSLNGILQKMSQIITQSQVAVHILEFLACLARMPEVYVNFREDDYRTVFGICFRYLQYVRDQRQKGSDSSHIRASIASEGQTRTKRESGPSTEGASISTTINDLPQYVYALAYHVITFWFMSVKMVDRAKYISWITKNLIMTDSTGKEVIDEQSQVAIDMLQRITYCDHDETLPDPHFATPSDGAVVKKSWLVGMSILTVETAVRSGVSQLTKRQPSATTYATYKSKRAQRPLHQVPLPSKTITDSHEESSVDVLPSHVLLQLTSSSWRTPESMRPIPLPDDDATRRAISMFDRNPTVDGHKVGIVYIGEGQTNEAEILSNVIGSEDFTRFLTQVGTLTRLKGASFNTQGLDRELNMDGEFTFCWRDRVTEIIFHIPTMMPTDRERDPQCINKKRHTGNDFVNIIWNNSGLAFRFDTFPSEFNYVNIVITPEARASPLHTPQPEPNKAEQHRFYKVQVMSKPGFPELSPAAETKVVSGRSLPAFVRLIALNASVFSLVWANRESGELVSSWRNRLREIMRLREKHSPTTTQAQGGGGMMGAGRENSAAAPPSQQQPSHRESLNLNFRRTSGPMFFGGEGMTSHRSSMLSNATTATATEAEPGGGGGGIDGESLVDGYDFSKWAS